ncbi:MAG: GH25 family lysozyme, partial [Thermomicrobiales bacterium]
EEAAQFLRNLPVPLPDWTHLALDAEERATRDVARYLTWLRTVRDATQTTPLFYTYPSFISEASDLPWGDLAEFPLWYAWYPNDSSSIAQLQMPSAPAGWPRVTIWQYSGGASVPGTTFPTDLNRFDGTLDELRALGKPGDISAEVVPMPPDPATVRAYLNDQQQAVLEITYGGTATSIEGVNIVDAGISVRNAAGDVYDRSVKANTFEPWSKRGQ